MKRSRPCLFSVKISHAGHTLRVTGTLQPAEPVTGSEYDGWTPGHPAYLDGVEIFPTRGKRERRLQDPDGKLAAEIEGAVFEGLS